MHLRPSSDGQAGRDVALGFHGLPCSHERKVGGDLAQFLLRFARAELGGEPHTRIIFPFQIITTSIPVAHRKDIARDAAGALR